jgi:hypothetical protein
VIKLSVTPSEFELLENALSRVILELGEAAGSDYAALLEQLLSERHHQTPLPEGALDAYCDTNYINGAYLATYKIDNLPAEHAAIDSFLFNRSSGDDLAEFIGLSKLLDALIKGYEEEQFNAPLVVIFVDSLRVINMLSSTMHQRKDTLLKQYFVETVRRLQHLREEMNVKVWLRWKSREEINRVLEIVSAGK